MNLWEHSKIRKGCDFKMADKENSRKFRNQYQIRNGKRERISLKKFDNPIKYLQEKLDVKKPLKPIPSIMLGFGDSSNQNNVTPSDPLYYNAVFKKARKDLKKKNEKAPEEKEEER